MERANGTQEVVFRGHVLTVRVDPVIARSGPTTREVVERGSAVGIVAETADHHLVVVKQYRWAVSEFLWELPAGLVEPGEPPLLAAKRELQEETGYQAGYWRPLHQYFSSPGYSTEMISIFYAADLVGGASDLDADEELTVHHWSREEARAKIDGGLVKNGLLLVGLSWWLSKAPRSG